MRLTIAERAIVLTALQVWQRELVEDPGWNHDGNDELRAETKRLARRYDGEQRRAVLKRSRQGPER